MRITKFKTYQASVPSKGDYRMERGTHESRLPRKPTWTALICTYTP